MLWLPTNTIGGLKCYTCYKTTNHLLAFSMVCISEIIARPLIHIHNISRSELVYEIFTLGIVVIRMISHWPLLHFVCHNDKGISCDLLIST